MLPFAILLEFILNQCCLSFLSAVTAYRHNSAAGYAAADDEDKENIDPAKKPRAKARPLPLRKRSIEADDGTSPLVARKALIRHDMKEDGDKITCRCKNSKCLK